MTGPEATVNPAPHIAAAGRGSLLNTEGWSDLPAEQWIEQELPRLTGCDGVLIASTGYTPAEVEQLAAPLAEAGADALELVSYRAEDAAYSDDSGGEASGRHPGAGQGQRQLAQLARGGGSVPARRSRRRHGH